MPGPGRCTGVACEDCKGEQRARAKLKHLAPLVRLLDRHYGLDQIASLAYLYGHAMGVMVLRELRDLAETDLDC